MNELVVEFQEEVAAKPPETYFDGSRERYLVRDAEGNWLALSEGPFKRQLRASGLSDRPETKGALSAVDEAIVDVQKTRNVAWIGELAGYPVGVHQVCGRRILVTRSPRILEPVEGDWTTLRQLIDAVLGTDGGVQVPYFLGWLKVGYEALRDRRFVPGQAVAMCGPHGCGKSFLQHVVTTVLGGRAARPFQAMAGGTAFNADWFAAEHLMIEDEQPSTDIRARRAFGAQLKAITANEGQRLHGKHRDAVLLRPFWRVTISLNSEAENVMVLPPIDDSLEDKVMLLKATRQRLPMPTRTGEEQAAFRARIESEVPAMLAHLVRWEIPPEMRSERFGVRHWHHPEILGLLDDVAPETRLLALIDAHMFPDVSDSLFASQRRAFIELSAEVLQSMLTDSTCPMSFEARTLLGWSSACGTYLGRLARKMPERVRQVRTATERKWRICAPELELEPEAVVEAPAAAAVVAPAAGAAVAAAVVGEAPVATAPAAAVAEGSGAVVAQAAGKGRVEAPAAGAADAPAAAVAEGPADMKAGAGGQV